MKKYIPVILLILNSSFIFGQGGSHLLNVISLKNGCRIVSAPPSFVPTSALKVKIGPWTQQGLMEETSKLGWCSSKGMTFPLTFVFELSELYSIEKLRFNNKCESSQPLISAKDVIVETSLTSATEGFTEIANITLEQNLANPAFDISPVDARWVRLSIFSNYGNPDYTELMEFEALGSFANINFNETDIIGLWNTNFDWVSINSNKNGYVYGCYKWEDGTLFSGEINRRVFNFKWSQKGDGQKGWATVIINEEGTRLNGIWGFNNDHTKFGIWEFTKESNNPYECKNDKEMENIIREKQNLAAANDSRENTYEEKSVDFIVEIVDAKTQRPATGRVSINSLDRMVAAEGETNNLGAYEIMVGPSSFLDVKINAPGYFPIQEKVSFVGDEKTTQTPVKRVFKLTPLEVGESFVLKHILFMQGEYELIPEFYPELDKLVAIMKEYPYMGIELAGHTDNQGDEQANIELSQLRVAQVKKYLIRKGIKAKRIKEVGYGGKYPIASNDVVENRKLNRRVEVKILKM